MATSFTSIQKERRRGKKWRKKWKQQAIYCLGSHKQASKQATAKENSQTSKFFSNRELGFFFLAVIVNKFLYQFRGFTTDPLHKSLPQKMRIVLRCEAPPPLSVLPANVSLKNCGEEEEEEKGKAAIGSFSHAQHSPMCTFLPLWSSLFAY